jgi:hypothetical protein
LRLRAAVGRQAKPTELYPPSVGGTMAILMRIRRARTMIFALVLGVAALGSQAGSVLATSPGESFHATLTGVTVPGACPPGTPAGLVCYTGQSAGTIDKPFVSAATEADRGFFDPTHPNSQGCIPNFALASITAANGSTLFVADEDFICGLGTGNVTENGTWQALGGTGAFAEAHGGGTYTVTGINQQTGVSTITYTGQISTGD